MSKKSDAQALKWMRDLCLSYPDASEGVHYGDIVFKSGGKMFASCGDKRGPRMIVLGLEAGHAAEVLAANPSFKRYPYEKSGIMIEASDVEDRDEMRAFVEESWRLHAAPQPNKAKTTKAKTKKKKKASAAKR